MLMLALAHRYDGSKWVIAYDGKMYNDSQVLILFPQKMTSKRYEIEEHVVAPTSSNL